MAPIFEFASTVASTLSCESEGIRTGPHWLIYLDGGRSGWAVVAVNKMLATPTKEDPVIGKLRHVRVGGGADREGTWVPSLTAVTH
jgi:hypothetical protein